MQKLIFVTISMVFLMAFPSRSSHIVGGEFEMIHLGDFTYRINLVMYFDKVNGSPPILSDELEIFPAIFRKGDGALMERISLLRTSVTPVSYSNPGCAVGELATLKLIFTRVIQLDPGRYNSQLGYYLIWERCCRNYNIDNIFSNPPTGDNDDRAAGNTFFLEFPKIVNSDGTPFINSSPVLFPPLSDYACVNRLYFANFAGEDPDGDSIAYTMVTPVSTSLSVANPAPTPPPHPIVTWRPGFSFVDQIPGSPSIGISSEGFLTVRPSVVGLFVFAIKAQEYRDGFKIGETRRDFQMLVLDCPDPGIKPELKVEVPPSELNPGGIFTDELSVEFTQEDEKCIRFQISDQDGSETVEIEALSVNFEENLDNIFSVTTGFLDDENSILEVEVCFQDCPPLENVPFIIDFIASDDACPLPLKDTLRMNILVQPPANAIPVLDSDRDDLFDSLVTLFIGEEIDFGLIGSDADGDSLKLFLADLDSITASMGFDFIPVNGIGAVESSFLWEASCEDLLRLDSMDIIHEFTFVLMDNAECFPKSDTLVIKARLVDKGFNVEPKDIPNIFTPNGDNINDTWGLAESFPPNNCEDEFLSVNIINRWGRPVYSSNDRNFRWNGGDLASGVYYYSLKFRNSEYKGPITLMK